MKKKNIGLLALLITALVMVFLLAPAANAVQDKILGVHILSPADLEYANKLFEQDDIDKDWHFLTVPLTLNDLNQFEYWQEFFKKARQQRFVPIVRLATRVEDGIWAIPNRREIVKMFDFLDKLPWPADQRFVIIFNEVNHAKEWGNKIDPAGYADILEFAARWANTESANYIVLPAAMDLAAPNGPETMEAFTYLNFMLEHNPRIFDHIDVWNSHSYPNPAFSSSPTLRTQNSIRGFEHELAYLENKTGRRFKVIITETGWVMNRSTLPWLTQYYLYAMQHVWTHPQVIGVTPFLLRGSPGNFAAFSFFDEHNQPTQIFDAFTEAYRKIRLE